MLHNLSSTVKQLPRIEGSSSSESTKRQQKQQQQQKEQNGHAQPQQ